MREQLHTGGGCHVETLIEGTLPLRVLRTSARPIEIVLTGHHHGGELEPDVIGEAVTKLQDHTCRPVPSIAIIENINPCVSRDITPGHNLNRLYKPKSFLDTPQTQAMTTWMRRQFNTGAIRRGYKPVIWDMHGDWGLSLPAACWPTSEIITESYGSIFAHEGQEQEEYLRQVRKKLVDTMPDRILEYYLYLDPHLRHMEGTVREYMRDFECQTGYRPWSGVDDAADATLGFGVERGLCVKQRRGDGSWQQHIARKYRQYGVCAMTSEIPTTISRRQQVQMTTYMLQHLIIPIAEYINTDVASPDY